MLEQLMGGQGEPNLPSQLEGEMLEGHSCGTACTAPLQPQHSPQIPNSPPNFQAERQFCNIHPEA